MATTHITAGLDDSRESATAARWTAREAELRGIALNLVHVDEGPDQRPPPPVPRPGNTRRSVEMLNPWRDKYPSVEMNPTQPLGRAAIQVLDASSDAALVVVGRHIRAAATFGPHIGAITHALLHHPASTTPPPPSPSSPTTEAHTDRTRPCPHSPSNRQPWCR
ncbi:universal stress protein [Streptomyces sp. NPDC059262]|uniref:universal stress protein n=1 Tax=Streptomyces sp. NPDC059262 TaxID=3346797 RepID=UPI00368A7847